MFPLHSPTARPLSPHHAETMQYTVTTAASYSGLVVYKFHHSPLSKYFNKKEGILEARVSLLKSWANTMTRGASPRLDFYPYAFRHYCKDSGSPQIQMEPLFSGTLRHPSACILETTLMAFSLLYLVDGKILKAFVSPDSFG